MREDVVEHRAGLDHAGPTDSAGHAVSTFPVGVLLASERRLTTIGPSELLGAVVGGIHHDRVVLETQLTELVKQLADVAVVLDHTVRINAEAGLALRFRLEARPDVHAGGVPPEEERLVLPL